MSDRPRFQVDLTGRTALVTGASSGIGAQFARSLARSGAAVVLGARRVERLETLAAEIKAEGGRALAVALDVADEASTQAAYDSAEQAFGGVDTVIANAGVSTGGSGLGLKIDDFDAMVAVNLRGVFLTAREGGRRMTARWPAAEERGRVVLISSITAHRAWSGLSAYSATKAAVAQLGRTLALEWAGKGVNVNVLCPGYIHTELTDSLWHSDKGKALLASFPRRRVMELDVLDPLMLYLCSDFSRQVTGSVFDVDDGQTLG